jgi:hypothetical protein
MQETILKNGRQYRSHPVHIYTVCNGGGGDRVVWRTNIYKSYVIHSVFDQIPNLPNCFSNPSKNLGGEGASDR